MNKELIRQLAEQAGLAQGADVRAGYIYPEGMEKFAELIVRECQYRVERYISDCGEISSLPDKVIIEHFGLDK